MLHWCENVKAAMAEGCSKQQRSEEVKAAMAGGKKDGKWSWGQRSHFSVSICPFCPFFPPDFVFFIRLFFFHPRPPPSLMF
jgi:hypothetical protein